MDDNLKKWQQKVTCKICKTTIYSRYSGEYISCKCGSIAVDQTPYYSRWIGEMHNFEMEEPNETE